MLLPGRIELTTFGDLVFAIHRERASGTLELVDSEARVHRVWFDSGTVSGVSTPLRVPALGELLAAQPAGLALEARRLLQASRFEDSAEPVGKRLVEQGFIEPESLEAALKQQLCLRLEAIARVRRGRVSFRPCVAQPREPIPLPLAEFPQGNARARRRSQAPRLGSQPLEPSREPRTRAEALAVLGLPEDADLQAVRSAFRRLAQETHPDTRARASSSVQRELAHRFARASAAYHVLVA